MSQLDCQPLKGKGTEPLEVFWMDEDEKLASSFCSRLTCESRGGIDCASLGTDVISSSDSSLGLSSQEWNSSAVSKSMEVSLGYESGVHSLSVSELSMRCDRIDPLMVDTTELSLECDELSFERRDTCDRSWICDTIELSSLVEDSSSSCFLEEAGTSDGDEQVEREDEEEEAL